MPDVFPFYDAEPWWYKRSHGSGSGDDSGGGGDDDTLPLVGSAIVGTAVLVNVNEGGSQ